MHERSMALQPPATGARPDDVRRGVALMLLTVLLTAALNTMVKALTARYPVMEVTFFRNAFALLPVGALVAAGDGRRVLRTGNLRGHLWRSAIGVVAMGLGFWSVHLLPLADAVAISFASPLFVAALSGPLLGERVGRQRWAAVLVGFVGVLVISRPSGNLLGAATLVPIAGAIAYALAMIAIRQLRAEHPVTVVFYFTLVSTLLCGLALPWSWVTPAPGDFVWMVLTGLVGGTSQYLLTGAYGAAPASLLGPFHYTQLVWAALLGWLVWGDVPGLRLWAGAAIVIAGGVWVVRTARAER